MRGLTPLERYVLTMSLPESDFSLEWDDDHPEVKTLDEVHESCARLGWMICLPKQEEDEESAWDYWITTARGKVALEADALVRNLTP